MSDWDLHDVIGAKPKWFYASCLDDYFAGWQDGSYDFPACPDEEFYQTCVELLGVTETGCQCDLSDPDLQAAQPAAEASPNRAEPRKRALSTGRIGPFPTPRSGDRSLALPCLPTDTRY